MTFPIGDVMDRMSVRLATYAGDTTMHVMGGKYLTKNDLPPRYVWVPTTATTGGPVTKEGPGEFRELGVVNEQVAVHCWGESFEQAWALRCNLLKALHDDDVMTRFADGAWLRSATQDSWVHRGEVYVLTIAVRAPTLDRYTNVATLAVPEVSEFVPTSSSWTISSVDAINDTLNEGEPLVAP